MTPVRHQLSRRKGWRLPANTTKVSRPGKYGNPFVVDTECALLHVGKVRDRAHAVALHAAKAAADSQFLEQVRTELKGRNLACWCHLCDAHRHTGKPFDVACSECLPCHADTLGRIANYITCEAV